MEYRPSRLVDVASSTYFVAFAAQVAKVVSIDIRPLRASLPGIECRQGDATHMPFPDSSEDAVSTLPVIEHVGLGRYGDSLDLAGMEKAAAELARILRPQGMLLVVFPTAKG